jgi:hypothetical protein
MQAISDTALKMVVAASIVGTWMGGTPKRSCFIA